MDFKAQGMAPQGAEVSMLACSRSRGSHAAANRLIAVGEVAKLLSVSDATVYALSARGILAHVRVLNAIRVAATALNALLTSPQRRMGCDD